jgi:hypothetical protein
MFVACGRKQRRTRVSLVDAAACPYGLGGTACTIGARSRAWFQFDFDSDEALEAILRRELIEIACFNGVSDPETLRDILLTRLPQVSPAP